MRKNISIKRAQSQAGLSFAERLRVGEPCSGMGENFRPQVKLRILSLLVLLLTAATGAWAQEQSETIATTANKVEGTHFTISNNGAYVDGDGMGAERGITVTPKNGEIITKVVISCTYQSGKVNDGNTSVSSGTKEITNGGRTITVTGVNATTFTFTSTSNAQFKQFVVYYTAAPAVTVDVTGVTLSPTSASLTVGDAVTLTATVAPDDATNKKVKWSLAAGTDKVKLYKDADCNTEVGTEATDVLTVYAKGIAAGEATVKVESNADATKSATCTVTAQPGSYKVAMKAGTPDADKWTGRAGGSGAFTGLPLTNVTGGTKPVQLKYNSTDRVVKRVKATIELAWNAEAEAWELDEMPEGNVEVEVEYKTDLTLTVNITGWTSGSTANTPTVSGNEGNGTVTYEYKLKGAADNTYKTDVPTEAGEYTVRATVAETDNYADGTATADFTIAAPEAPASTDIVVTAHQAITNGAYWATFYTTEGNYQAPTGTEVYAITLNNGKLTMNPVADGIVNSGLAVVLKSTTGSLTMTKTETTGSFQGTSSLNGTLTVINGNANGNIYVLNTGSKGAGFYKLNPDNGKIAPNKAYLVYDGAAGARDYFLFDETTAISAPLVNSEEVNSEVYDLQGRRVKNAAKGVYIVNGRKVVVK